MFGCRVALIHGGSQGTEVPRLKFNAMQELQKHLHSASMYEDLMSLENHAPCSFARKSTVLKHFQERKKTTLKAILRGNVESGRNVASYC